VWSQAFCYPAIYLVDEVGVSNGTPAVVQKCARAVGAQPPFALLNFFLAERHFNARVVLRTCTHTAGNRSASATTPAPVAALQNHTNVDSKGQPRKGHSVHQRSPYSKHSPPQTKRLRCWLSAAKYSRASSRVEVPRPWVNRKHRYGGGFCKVLSGGRMERVI